MTPAEPERSYTGSLARRMRSDAGSPTLVIAPYLSPCSRTVLKKAGINYLDLTGNAQISIDHPGLSILTQGAQRAIPRPASDRTGVSLDPWQDGLCEPSEADKLAAALDDPYHDSVTDKRRTTPGFGMHIIPSTDESGLDPYLEGGPTGAHGPLRI